VGSGSPTVVLEAGLGADTHSWQDVQPHLGRSVRTCAYDRAGIGNSVARPDVHDARDDIDDLQRLLDGARLDPPYVLVGQSYGGLLVRLFAHAHPEETARLALVEAKGRDQMRRELAIWPKSQAPELRRSWARPVRDGVDLASGDALADRVTSLGDTPLAVITAGTHKSDSAAMPAPLARALYGLWVRMQDELAALSRDHVHVVALNSDPGCRSGASTAETSGSTAGPTSSCAQWRRSSAPRATARDSPRAGACSAAPTFAAAARSEQRARAPPRRPRKDQRAPAFPARSGRRRWSKGRRAAKSQPAPEAARGSTRSAGRRFRSDRKRCHVALPTRLHGRRSHPPVSRVDDRVPREPDQPGRDDAEERRTV
jgi:pimeloyl-ACP methyl ester carboxylesterase